jgi:hypothetical protein
MGKYFSAKKILLTVCAILKKMFTPSCATDGAGVRFTTLESGTSSMKRMGPMSTQFALFTELRP